MIYNIVFYIIVILLFSFCLMFIIWPFSTLRLNQSQNNELLSHRRIEIKNRIYLYISPISDITDLYCYNKITKSLTLITKIKIRH